MTSQKRLMGTQLVLRGKKGSFAAPMIVETGKRGYDKRQVQEAIKSKIQNWVDAPGFKDIRNEFLDLAIIASVNPQRMKTQDVDNISKTVLDALQQGKNDSRFLFYNDNQIIRLLVWKVKRTEQKDCDTDSLEISFRVHDSKKQMTLEKCYVI